MADRTFVVDWGVRSEQLRARFADLGARKSFLLTGAPTPVTAVAVPPAQVAQWDAVAGTPLTVTPVPNTFRVNLTVPDTVTMLRLDFSLKVSVDGKTATCLEFHQLFQVGPGATLSPTQYAFTSVELTTGPGPGATAPLLVPTGGANRIVLGACPLVRVTTTTVEVNCEFLDVTQLWWAIWAAKDNWGWYLDPDLGGRPDRLRVLAWTSGTAPMLWFVSVSDNAANGGAAPATGGGRAQGADVVFFRAPAGFNSFVYTADESGFKHAMHGDRTMFHLARWLLSPLPHAEMTAKLAKPSIGGRPDRVMFASMRLIPDNPAPAISPADPLDLIPSGPDGFRWAFRPIGVEEALKQSPSEDIAFLPLSFDGFEGPFVSGGGYTALLKKDGLADILNSARALLWMRGAIHRNATAAPTTERQIWLLANSGANGPMFGCLRGNMSAIDRVITCDATSNQGILLLNPGVPAISAAAKARAKLQKAFKVVCVTTPNMWTGMKGKTQKAAFLDIQKQVIATGAAVTFLPADAEWDDYWTHPPTASSNPLTFEVMKAWDGNGLTKSKQFGTVSGGRQWLFWHEWSVNGGHLEVSTGPTGATKVRVRTFFEDALKLV